MKKHSKKLFSLCLTVFITSGITQPILANPGCNVSEKVKVSQQQGRTVTGVITDAADGNSLIGVNIVVKGTQTGVISDIDGKYSIKINSSKDILVISYIGYKTREVPVEDLAVINIKLESDNEVLDEVVIVGSGSQKKVSVTGAITTLKGASLKTTTSSLSNAFAGKLSGVISTANSGEPGAGSSFYIRGISTFNGRATPLILLDDVEISEGDLNNIPAETIESFSVLKDASATAIYGSRGANGVLIVTTKKGVENSKTKVSMTFENSFQSPMNFPDFVDGATWMELYNEALATRGKDIRYQTYEIENTRNHVNEYVYPDVDWGNLIFKDMTMSQRANVNVQGGGSRVTYYMSLNVNHDSGILKSPSLYSIDNNINNLAYNFQNNIAVKVSPTTKLRLNMNAQIRNNKGPNYSPADLFQKIYYVNPVFFPAVYPAQEGDEHIRFGNIIYTGGTVKSNPYADMVSSFKQQNLSTLNTSLRIDQKLDFITKGLSANALVNFKTYSSAYYTRDIDPYYYSLVTGSYDPMNPTTYELERAGTSGTDYIVDSGVTRTSDQTIMMQFQLNYQRQFGQHSVGGMLMYMQRDYKFNVNPSRNQSFSGRFTYDYGQRYLAEFNFGYNGSERFAKGRRFQFFPAASFGWIISNEKFFKPLTKVIDHLKLRTSYGLVGSDGSNYPYNFFYIDQLKLNSIGFTTGDNLNYTLKGPEVINYRVADAGWERSRKFDIGFEMNLFSDLRITFDYFKEKRDRILMERASWPNHLGYKGAVPWAPVGKIDNWGYEFSLNYQKQIGKDWKLDFRGNFTYTENKYVEKDEVWHEYPWQVQTGRPLSTMYGYIAEGLFISQEEIDTHAKQDLGSVAQIGDIKYRDLNGDGIINTWDQAYISNMGRQPRIQYGFGLNVNYKKWDLGVFFNGSAMRKIMVNGLHPFGQNDYSVFQFIADDHWSENNPNPNAKYPRLGLINSDIANNTPASSYWMRNGNFLRFKTLEVGYSFKYGRVYITGDNLAVFSPFKEWDPELNWNSYPLQRTFNLGLQLNF